MKCSITGRVAIVPVVSKISGHLFEKELIEKHIRDDGTCPITGNPLTMDDIIVIRKVPYSKSAAPAAPALNGSSSSNTKSSSYSAAPALNGSSSSNTKSSSNSAAPALNGSCSSNGKSSSYSAAPVLNGSSSSNTKSSSYSAAPALNGSCSSNGKSSSYSAAPVLNGSSSSNTKSSSNSAAPALNGSCSSNGKSSSYSAAPVLNGSSSSNTKSSSNSAAPALNGSCSSNGKSSSYSAAPVLNGSSSSNTKSSSYSAAPALNGSSSTNTKTAVDGSACPQFPRSISKEIKVTRRNSSGMRRHRRIEIATSADALRGYIFNKGYTLHKTIMPGVLSMDIDNSKSIIATGGADTNAVVFDLSGKTVSTLSGHSEKVTSVKFVNEGELVVTGSCDKTVRLWQKSEKGSYKCKNTLDHHTAEVRAVTIHPSQKYFVTASDDCSWQFYDLASESHVTRGVGKGSESFSTAVFHPDGRILGTCALNLVRFWDVAKQNDILKIDAHTGRTVTSIAFSENGYTLATAAGDGVKLWDIRFLRTMHTLPSDDICSQTRSVEFDHSGKYLATGGGACISIYDIAAKPYPITTFSHMSGKGDLSCVKFGKNSEYVAAARTLDSKLLLFGPSEGNNSYNC
ncbi:hypothetical protein POM88_054684 [Heracleum sosnowskyi]|uniref:Pre-mRNA-processing factor 19 n=1 Tax=Heracleum sosnowskyi TaxID=360622 RepID=A0AAD8GLV8_9APIA|nr:hypothetical protein POM88_054684 [Heracleum sosnowskyi]